VLAILASDARALTAAPRASRCEIVGHLELHVEGASMAKRGTARQDSAGARRGIASGGKPNILVI
jgi:hypothetical protein